MTSFISEHTAEFYLVPQFETVLRVQHTHVVSFAFLSTREGTNWSQDAPFPLQVRLCAMFPRRPKIAPKTSQLYMKVNAVVFEAASILQQSGIPVFAGFPVIRSLAEFTNPVRCDWFLFGSDNSHDDVFVDYDNDNNLNYQTGAIRGPLSGAEGCALATNGSAAMSWSDGLETLHDFRRRQRYSLEQYFRFGPQYRPVFFVFF